MVYLVLAEGLAAVEAVGTFDVLVRAGLSCRTVGVPGKEIVSAQGLRFTADCLPEDLPKELPDLLVLPGGRGGVDNIMASKPLRTLAERMMEAKLPLGAICAAPEALGAWGLLAKRRVSCHPTVREAVERAGAFVSGNPVDRDGALVTGNGPGATLIFALTLVELLKGKETAARVAAQFDLKWDGGSAKHA